VNRIFRFVTSELGWSEWLGIVVLVCAFFAGVLLDPFWGRDIGKALPVVLIAWGLQLWWFRARHKTRFHPVRRGRSEVPPSQ
jgi:hypothetical protein